MTRVARAVPPAAVSTRADRIRALRRELATLEQQQRDADDRALLVAIARAVRGHVFSIAELVAHATIDPPLREALGGMRPKQLGVRLHRLAQASINGVRLRRVDRDTSGCIWEVHLHTEAGAHGVAGAE
jgi:hypothetical protein